MSCRHSLKELLNRTQFAQDGAAMRRSKSVYVKYQSDSKMHIAQSSLNTALRVSNHLSGDVNLVSELNFPQLDTTLTAEITDHGPHLDYIHAILREYALYEYDHAVVYDAIVKLFGQRRFGTASTPADALTFAALAALLFTFAEALDMTGDVSEETRNYAKVVSTLVSVQDEFLQNSIDELRQNQADQQCRHLYNQMLIGKDRTSTFMTDLFWSTLCILFEFGGDMLVTSTDKFMEFVAAAKQVAMTEAAPVSITANGEVAYMGDTYRVVGYCADGVMLGKIHGGVKGAESSSFVGLFCRAVGHFNAKNEQSVCGGCSTRVESEDGRLYEYKNSLISADISTAHSLEVGKKGRVSFKAETMLLDKRTNKVIRTGMREHRADIYDLHGLVGIDTSCSEKLSCLFPVASPLIKSGVKCNGVKVLATLERMDSYEVDGKGRILSIKHGKETKYAEKSSGKLKWGAKGGAAFNVDDLVQ